MTAQELLKGVGDRDLEIIFTKKDGTERTMRCKLSEHVTIGKDNRRTNINDGTMITVFDLDEFDKRKKEHPDETDNMAARYCFRNILIASIKEVTMK